MPPKMQPVIYKDPLSQIGFDRQNSTYVNTVTPNEWKYFNEQLQDKASGTKVSCTTKETLPAFLHRGRELTPTHTFTARIHEGNLTLFAISKDKKLLIGQGDSDEEGITPLEWHYAENIFIQDPNRSKLSAYAKYYVSHDEITVRHHAIKISE